MSAARIGDARALVDGRPLMSEDEQHAKLRLVETAARYYWGNEI